MMGNQNHMKCQSAASPYQFLIGREMSNMGGCGGVRRMQTRGDLSASHWMLRSVMTFLHVNVYMVCLVVTHMTTRIKLIG